MLLITSFLAFTIIGIILIASAQSKRAGAIGITSIIGIVATTIVVITQYAQSPDYYTPILSFNNCQYGHILFACDGLSTWFMSIVGITFILGTIYGKGYLKHYESTSASIKLHWISIIITLSGMIMLFTSRHLILFLVGWEMMAIGSFFAVIFESKKPTVIKAGLNYFIQSHIAVLFITIAFAWAYSRTQDLAFSSMIKFFDQATPNESFVMMMLLVTGFGFKAGIIPFHTWLPQAHPAAPSHISALMSGVIVKAGIYGIIRFGSLMYIGQTSCGVAILTISILSGLYGIINAAVHRDFKRMLAYCTIENIGIIGMGIGVGLIGMGVGSDILAILGFSGALLHTFNHAIFKTLLFFGAGNIYISTHTRNMEELGGLCKQMPRTSMIFLIGSLAIGGLPPFGGFISEYIIYGSFLNGFHLDGISLPILMAIAGGSLAIIGGISMMTFTKSYGVIFLGTPRTILKHEPHEVNKAMLYPSYILIALICMTLIAPVTLFKFTCNIAIQSLGIVNTEIINNEIISYSNIINKLAIAMLILTAIILFIFLIRYRIVNNRPHHTTSTWGCGYGAPIKGIQYTSKSFVRTLIELFRFILPNNTRFRQITSEEIFPQDRSHMSADADFWEHSLITPSIDKMLNGLSKFKFIQNGNLQRYIVYGLAYTIILVASATIF